VTYAQLKSGKIKVNGKTVLTYPISSYSKAQEIASVLKEWINTGEFLLSSPVAPLPGIDDNITMNTLEEK
jgi:uncharacterized protein (DUF39 family)